MAWTAEGWRFVALIRLVPLVPFNLLNYALCLTGISERAYVFTSALCMLPGAIAYTWLGYAARSSAAGNASALRYGLFGFGVLAMIAFLPRLFRRLRARATGWIDTAELQRRLASQNGPMVIDVRQPEVFGIARHLPRAINVPLANVAGRAAELAIGRLSCL
jgi:SNARE associated Golgi protein